MFTGIVEATAPLLALADSHLTVGRPPQFDDVKLGSSIAVNGCCLTIVELDERSMGFDLTQETLAKTAFAALAPGSALNLERALKADARLDGHIVQGHCEGVGEVVAVAPEQLQVRIQKQFMKNVVPKGSIAIDGVSLTIAELQGDVLSFAIIPFTWEHTILRNYVPGSPVNIETDVLGRRLS